ncbi:hypothetical protein BGZ63DRAFT_386450 [Mariannaea sp. PMI_226]|nr:hypothetical protein BGZ63DRAFT_386450 [Mariannaea sp. PMI_226]
MIFNSFIIAFALSGAVIAVPQAYPNKCGDTVCPADKPKCCSVLNNGEFELGCFAECPSTTTTATTSTSTTAPPSAPTFGPKCGDSFFCPVGKVCCENALYHCADPGKQSQQCPSGPPTFQ